MGSYFYFNNYGNDPGGEGRSLPGNYPVARQPSLYSLTFDELQNTMGGSLGKDFGSMNMDELLKSIWNAEETQTMGPGHSGAGQGRGGGGSGGYLQRQGSLTLPRTLSQMTVDEVWKDMSKEFVTVKDGNGVGGSGTGERQHTLGEITLDEFFVRAGVVREDVQLAKNPTYNTGVFEDLALDGSNSVLNFDFQQAGRSVNVTGGKTTENSGQMGVHSPILPLNNNGISSNQKHLGAQQEQPIKQRQQTLFPKQPTFAYGASVAMPTTGELGSPRVRDGIVKFSDKAVNNNLVHSAAMQGGAMGMAGLGVGGATVANGSPAVSSDGMGKNNGELSSMSPVPYVFNGGFRGRKSSTLEKVVERRQRRMIKNRESAARSRARKQAYTMELEAEVAQLNEENEELRKKQAKMIEMQKNRVLEMMSAQPASKRGSLRRTQTSPW
ncbi:basic leucine zipper transcription factor [Lithospermum erythrorhizon]|uniref:Basic leucine zipper transcription factor n=1 Tax=Lithospermum erythrorhizon TaxID=34254 RepID=A0AAV3RJR1_LITER